MQVSDGDFAEKVLHAQTPVLVDFWASWCPPCKMMEPMIDRLQAELAPQTLVMKLNVDRNAATASTYNVQSLPTFILFHRGREVARRTGAQTENQLRQLVGEVDSPDAAPAVTGVTIVSGLPRSGTSMMMRMLQAGGVPPLSDGRRVADADNPDGYFELEAVKATIRDASWLRQAEGKAVKMVYRLVKDLPDDRKYRVLLMRRHMPEILESQRRMLERQQKRSATDDYTMAALFRRDLAKFLAWSEKQSHVSLLQVSFNDIIARPAEALRRVNLFLGGGLDIQAMAALVNPALYRNRAA